MIRKILTNENGIILTYFNPNNNTNEVTCYLNLNNVGSNDDEEVVETEVVETKNIQLSRAVLALYVNEAASSEVDLVLKELTPQYLIDSYMGKAKDNYLYVDITDELQDAINRGKHYITLLFNGDANNHYIFEDSDNKLYLEYSSKNDENEKSVSLETPSSLAGSGKVNLATGQLDFSFVDDSLGNSALPITLSHHYNQSHVGSNEFNCGNGWKLNAQQYLRENKVDNTYTDKVNTAYTWINAEGKEIAFMERFYYLDDKKEKKYVYASDVQLNADGSYTKNDGTVLTKECVSDGGLILEAEPKNIKNKDLFYTASEEIESLEQRLKSINDAIPQIEGSKEYKNVIEQKIASYNSILGSVKQICLNRNLDILFADLKKELARVRYDGTSSDVIDEVLTHLNDYHSIINNLCALHHFSISAVNKIELGNKITNTQLEENINIVKEILRNLKSELTPYYNFFHAEEERLKQAPSEDVPAESNELPDSLFEFYFLTNSFILSIYDLVLSTYNNILSTENQYKQQSDILQKQKYQYEEQLRYYRQNQPTYFIKDGDLIYGFGDATEEKLMRLILVVDKFENYISYSYDRAGKLVKIMSSNGENIALEYENNLLKSITDSNGKTISYSYNNNNLVYASYRYFYYNNNYLIGATSDLDLLGVGFEYSDVMVTGMCSLQRYKSITNGKAQYLPESEIADNDAFTLSNTKYKKHNSVSINYYDYKTVIVTDNTTGKSVTYLFDCGGNLASKYENSFEKALSGQHTKGVAYQKTGNKVSYSASQNEFADELTSDATTQLNGFTSNNENPAISEILDADEKDNLTVVKTLSAAALQKIKESKEECFVLSGWAKANSLPINTYNSNSLENGASEFSRNLTELLLSSNDKINIRKFELRAEVTFQSGTTTRTSSFKTTFDWMNDNWQYCAIPINISQITKSQIKEIKLIFDYSNNFRNVHFFGMSLKEGKWEKETYDDKGNVEVSETGDSDFWTVYDYDEDNRLLGIVKVAELPGDDGETELATSYSYNSQNALAKVVDCDKTVIEYVYDDKGNVVKEMVYNEDEPANKFITEHVINEDGSSTQSVDALGNKTVSSYDKQGNLVEQTDALGNKVAFGYENTFGALANITASVNGETSSNENVYECGLLVKTKHNGCEYEFDYDGLGRKTAVRINGDTYCTISYEGNDTQTITYASGEKVKKVSSADGRKYDVFYAKAGQNLLEPTIFEYDKSPVDTEKDKYNYKEYIEDRTNSSNHVTYKTYYDKKDRVAKTEISGGDYGEKLRTENRYGFENALIYQKVEIGNKKFDEETRSYEYGLKNKLTSIQHEGAFTESPTLDKLGRVATIQKGSLTKKFNYYQNGERATTLVASETFGENNKLADKLSYTYDKKGNISEIRQNGELVARYEYDSLNRLVREDNRPLNKSYFMTYDTAGNIVEKKESAFTLGLFDTVVKTTTGTYKYADNGVMDRLLSYNGEECKYDVDELGNPTNTLGNPTTYRGKQAKWSHVNRLAKFGDIEFKYNYAGTRLFKTVGGKTTKYYCDGAKVIAQDNGTDMLYFYYGTEGVTAFKYKYNVYHYKKDMLGNILGIYDANGQLLVKYVYDAWGNHKTFALTNGLWVDISNKISYNTSDDIAIKVAILNPFRYRSYYYDVETGLYYLQSRYYDPETGRFISMDNISYLDPESIHGLNLYAYCGNNPVMCVDPSGQSILAFLAVVGIAALISAIDGGISAAMCGQSFFKGFAAGFIGGAIGGAISFWLPGPLGMLLGRAVNSLTYGLTNEFFQNGNLDNLNKEMLAFDVTMDVILSMTYVDSVLNIRGSDIFKTVIGGEIDSVVDIIQTGLFYTPQAQTTITNVLKQFFKNFGDIIANAQKNNIYAK